MSQTIPESLARLSRAWPTAPITAEAKLGYAEACMGYDPRDVADAVQRFVWDRQHQGETILRMMDRSDPSQAEMFA